MNDAELLRRYVEQSSQEAFAELVRLRIGLVYSAALRQTGGDVHRAQDVAQAVFTELARNAGPLCRHRALIGWLFTTTRNTAAKIVRAERRRRFWEQEASSMHENLVLPTREIPAERLRPLLDDVMNSLSESDRIAVLLRFFDGCSLADLGGHLGLSESTAQKKVERALGKLRTLLAKRGLSSTAAAIGAALSQEATAAVAPAGLAASISGSALIAGSAAMPGISLVSIMTASKVAAIIGVATILGLFSIGTGFYELRESQRSEAALKTNRQRYEDGQQQLRALQRNAQTAGKTLVDLQSQIIAAAAILDQAKAVAAKKKADWQRFAAAYPAIQAVMVDVFRHMNERNYRLSLERGEITATQFEELVNRRVQSQMQDIQLSPGGIDSHGDISNSELRAILGEQGYQRWQNTSRMQDAFSMVAWMGTPAAYAGSPLSSEQEEGMAQILAGVSPTFKNGRGVGEDLDWNSAGAQAKKLLSPSQWKAVEGVFLTNEYGMAENLAQENQNAASAPGSGGN